MDFNLLSTVEDSFSIYAAMTIQNRALVDARDCLKPSQRQCMYAQFLDKITYKKPFKKSNKSVAAALDHFYYHGDASCYALLTRLAKNFAMRYPLEDFDGSYGTISDGNSEAASRYTEMRLGELGCLLYDQIEKDCIKLWYDNYDNTEQFPSVVPSLGYYNICNGTMGIATSLATSIPQYNLREVNAALIKLLYNPDIDFEEIYCAPDFCTGATILNANEVKQAHKEGCGHSAIIRSTITYDEKERCLYVSEIPYGVYAGVICQQIKDCLDEGKITGISNVLDLSTKQANIKILLDRGARVEKVVKQLYKMTSLQSSYTINFTMLDQGTKPRVFTWKEALQAHLDHELSCYTKIHEFEISKIRARIEVIDGLLIALANIDDVVSIIKKAKDKEDAKNNLQTKFSLTDSQAEAILKMTLSRLTNLETINLQEEKKKLLEDLARHQEILNTPQLQKDEIKEGLLRVMEKWGDERRTKILNLEYRGDEDDPEPIEEKQLIIYYTNLGNIYTQESSTLVRTRRGAAGSKIKLASNEVIEKVISDSNLGTLLIFSNKGSMYHVDTCELPINEKVNINHLFNFDQNEHPTTLVALTDKSIEHFIFLTKNGMIKKTKAQEYFSMRGKSIKAISLKDNDEVVNVIFSNDPVVGILTNNGNFIKIETDNISATGRATCGVKAIKLSVDDFVIDAKPIDKDSKFLITLSKKGFIKKTSMTEFPLCNKGIKGKKISAVKPEDMILKFLTFTEDCDIMVISEKRALKFSTKEIRLLSRAAVGVQSIRLENNESITDLKGGLE